MPTFATTTQHNTESIARAMRQDKEINSIQTAKEEVKFPHFTDIMILYIRL